MGGRLLQKRLLKHNPCDESGAVDALGSVASGSFRSRANMAQIGQSRPDSGLGFQAKALEPF